MRALRLIAARLAAAVPTVALVSLGTFLLLEVAPGDAADAYLAQTGGDAGFAGALRERLGLTGTTPERLLRYYTGLLQGDLGTSAVFNRPVFSVILERLPTSLLLMGSAVAFAAILGSLLGLLAGARPRGWRDQAITVATLGLLAMPNFWLALLLVLWFGVRLAWFPISGLQSLGVRRRGLRPPSTWRAISCCPPLRSAPAISPSMPEPCVPAWWRPGGPIMCAPHAPGG
jgi:peptide/nickel transport system permease protein